MKRKSLMVRLDLADKISSIAERRGTLYDYVNDILEQAIKADELGLALKDILEDRLMIKSARDAGFMVVPEMMVYDLAEVSYKRVGKEKMSAIWYETGQWYGHYYGDLKKLRIAVKRYFWDVSGFNVSEEGANVALSCLSSKFSVTYTDLFSKFLEGAMNALGYRLNQSEVSKGIINLKFAKSSEK